MIAKYLVSHIKRLSKEDKKAIQDFRIEVYKSNKHFPVKYLEELIQMHLDFMAEKISIPEDIPLLSRAIQERILVGKYSRIFDEFKIHLRRK